MLGVTDGMWVEVTARALEGTRCFHLPWYIPMIHHEKNIPQALIQENGQTHGVDMNPTCYLNQM